MRMFVEHKTKLGILSVLQMGVRREIATFFSSRCATRTHVAMYLERDAAEKEQRSHQEDETGRVFAEDRQAAEGQNLEAQQ